jgi:class 3 adenylate cyclase
VPRRKRPLPGRHIRDAKYVELPGSDHAPWTDGDDIVAEIREFLTGVREPVTPDRVLATLLFTGIVASTEHATRLGDRRWRDLVSDHRLIRHELARFRGREIDSAGDGFLAARRRPSVGAARRPVDRSRRTAVGNPGTLRSRRRVGDPERRARRRGRECRRPAGSRRRTARGAHYRVRSTTWPALASGSKTAFYDP